MFFTVRVEGGSRSNGELIENRFLIHVKDSRANRHAVSCYWSLAPESDCVSNFTGSFVLLLSYAQ